MDEEAHYWYLYMKEHSWKAFEGFQRQATKTDLVMGSSTDL